MRVKRQSTESKKIFALHMLQKDLNPKYKRIYTSQETQGEKNVQISQQDRISKWTKNRM